jgi:hypothetical protein
MPWVLNIPHDFSIILKVKGDRTNIYVDAEKIKRNIFGELAIEKGGKVWASFKNGEEIEKGLKEIFYDDELIGDIIRRLKVVNFISERV